MDNRCRRGREYEGLKVGHDVVGRVALQSRQRVRNSTRIFLIRVYSNPEIAHQQCVFASDDGGSAVDPTGDGKKARREIT